MIEQFDALGGSGSDESSSSDNPHNMEGWDDQDVMDYHDAIGKVTGGGGVAEAATPTKAGHETVDEKIYDRAVTDLQATSDEDRGSTTTSTGSNDEDGGTTTTTSSGGETSSDGPNEDDQQTIFVTPNDEAMNGYGEEMTNIMAQQSAMMQAMFAGGGGSTDEEGGGGSDGGMSLGMIAAIAAAGIAALVALGGN